MKYALKMFLLIVMMLVFGCEKPVQRDAVSSRMACGAGKCGAAMMGGSKQLIIKKDRILSQMKQDDPRRGCVLQADDVASLFKCIE